MKDQKVLLWSLVCLLGAVLALASAQHRVAAVFNDPTHDPSRAFDSADQSLHHSLETTVRALRSREWVRECW